VTTTYGGIRVTAQVGDTLALGASLGQATRRARVDWGARRHGTYIDPLSLLGGVRVALVPVR
jgi:hypothetical protein